MFLPAVAINYYMIKGSEKTEYPNSSRVLIVIKGSRKSYDLFVIKDSRM